MKMHNIFEVMKCIKYMVIYSYIKQNTMLSWKVQMFWNVGYLQSTYQKVGEVCWYIEGIYGTAV
jgi:hypothetical protein